MTALWHIIVKSLINTIKELPKKPGKLALYLLAISGIVGMIILSFFTRPSAENQVPLFWFTGIFFLFITLFTYIAVAKGTSNGDIIFEMNDVNLLFVSPISPRKILLYGILRLVKVSFLAGFFILFQANSLANFGIRFDGVLITLAGFMLSMVVLSIISLLIYSLTNGNSRRKLFVKAIAFILFLPLIIFLAIQMLQDANLIAALEAAIKSPYLTSIPIAGWTTAGVTAFLSGEILKGILFFGIEIIVGVALVVYILLTNPDYYEDTLVATETAFEKRRELANGNINVQPTDKKPVRTLKTGISGYGASSIFYKHIRESFRQNRFGLITLPSVIMIGTAVAMAIITKNLIMTLQILMWIQIVLIGTGRGLKETYSHYIYMIPESSFKKILWSNMEVMLKTLIESVLIFGVSGLLTGENILIILSCIAVYTLFSFMLLGVNYLSMRITGTDISGGIFIMIYYLSVIIMILPGLVPAMIVGYSVGGNAGALIGLTILFAWELIAGLICFALSSGVLHNCDMPTVRQKG